MKKYPGDYIEEIRTCQLFYTLPTTLYVRFVIGKKYFVKTAISEIHCCVVTLCLTVFMFDAFS